MGLKQDIIIKSQFTNLHNNSSGSSPGKFILNYMNRENAVERLTPDRDHHKLDDFILNYMQRTDATEKAIADYDSKYHLQDKLDSLNKDGRGFGNLGVSYSQKDSEIEAKKIQKSFDNGHTVFKIVISFTEDYLKRTGIIDKSFVFNGKGSYRDNIDELKLRRAINSGIKKMANKAFKKPIWCAAVQVDTKHVHAHIALAEDADVKVEESPLFSKKIKQERGKLPKRFFANIRHGLHFELIDMKSLHKLHKQSSYSQQDILANLDNLIITKTNSNIKLQQVIASLPKNKRLWRAKSNAKVMRRPKQLLNEYLDDLIRNYGSNIGYDKYQTSMDSYLKFRKDNDHLNNDELAQLRKKSDIQLREKMINRVLKNLKSSVSKNNLIIQTPYLKQKAYDLQEVRSNIAKSLRKQEKGEKGDDLSLTLFTYRLSNYNQRLIGHHNEANVYHEAVSNYDKQLRNNNVSNSSIAVRNYYWQEQLYHMRATDKYRKFILPFDFEPSDKLKYQKELIYSQRNDAYDEYLKNEEAINNQLTVKNIVDKLLSDKEISNVLDLNFNSSNSIRQDLNLIAQGHFISNDDVVFLDTLGQQKNEYKNIGSSIQRLQLQTSNSIKYGGSYDNYLKLLSDYTYNSWSEGFLRANQVVDYNSSKNLSGFPEIPDLTSEKISNADFELVKGVDLHDLIYDFGNIKSRKVGNRALNEYKDSNYSRLQASRAAQNFAIDTQQPHQQIDRLIKQLNTQLDIEQQISSNKQLPIIIPELDSDISQRELQSINLQNANTITKKSLNSIRHEAQNHIIINEFDIDNNSVVDENNLNLK